MRYFIIALLILIMFIFSTRASMPASTGFLGTQLVKHFEGFSACKYDDIAGYSTIGYGHKVVTDDIPECITPHEAHDLLERDLLEAEACVRNSVKIALTQSQFDALVSFVFNLGCGNFRRSTLLKRINETKLEKAANEILRWNKARINGKLTSVRGLSIRRRAEKFIFES